MAKEKKETQTATEPEQNVEPEQPTVETPPEETTATPPEPAKAKKPDETTFVCPACQHTACVQIGAPYQKNGQTLQYVKCEKCNHISVDIL